MLTITVSFVLDPLANIAVTSGALPDAISVLHATVPLAVISVTVYPRVQALTTDAALFVVTQVLVAVAEPFVALSVALVPQPVTFIHATDLVYANTFTVAHAIIDLASVK